jgi:hypothetical protein
MQPTRIEWSPHSWRATMSAAMAALAQVALMPRITPVTLVAMTLIAVAKRLMALEQLRIDRITCSIHHNLRSSCAPGCFATVLEMLWFPLTSS